MENFIPFIVRFSREIDVRDISEERTEKIFSMILDYLKEESGNNIKSYFIEDRKLIFHIGFFSGGRMSTTDIIDKGVFWFKANNGKVSLIYSINIFKLFVYFLGLFIVFALVSKRYKTDVLFLLMSALALINWGITIGTQYLMFKKIVSAINTEQYMKPVTAESP